MSRLLVAASIAVVSLVLAPAQVAAADPGLRSSIMPIFAQVADTYTFEVITIPSLPGVEVTLDGVTRTTNGSGRTSFTVRRVNGEFDPLAAQRVVVGTTELAIDDRTVARYARPVERLQNLTLMYSRYYKTAFDFTDANDRVIPNSTIESTTIKSSTGEALEIDVTDENWLLGTRVSGSARPEVKPVFWTINDVLVNGTSVAHRGQTKFFPETEPNISSGLLLFDVRFRTVDAFFGFPAGDALTLGTPGGETIVLDLEDGEAGIDQLPRGEYEVVIEGSGLRIGRPVTLTRNQDLRLLYYTTLDIALVVIFLSVFLILPFVIGVRRRRSRDGSATAASLEPLASAGEQSSEAEMHLSNQTPMLRRRGASS